MRQGADFCLNGKHIGLHENGVMAVGFDLTPYLNFDSENVIAVRTDNSWRYKKRSSHSRFQWNDKNFNANYGGIPKNVWLHITDKLYQTLPLYSNLQTTGVYIYATDIHIKNRTATINAESQVCNERSEPVSISYEVSVYDYDGKLVNTFKGKPALAQPQETITVKAGKITLKAEAQGLASDAISFTSIPVKVDNGLSTFFPGDKLPSIFDRGETPSTPSYKDSKIEVGIKSAVAGTNSEEAIKSYDDNELSEWKNDGKLNTAWITYQLERIAEIDDICIKLTGWRMRSYPLEVFANNELIWSGNTEKSLGYVHLPVKPVKTDKITIRLKGATQDSDAFGQIVEVAAPTAGELDLYKSKGGNKTGNELRIIEIEFLEALNK